jgi:hypothetical protein
LSLTFSLIRLPMEGAPMFNPVVAGNGSSITVLVKRGRIVYNAIDIAIAAIMIKITILFLFIHYKHLV